MLFIGKHHLQERDGAIDGGSHLMGRAVGVDRCAVAELFHVSRDDVDFDCNRPRGLHPDHLSAARREASRDEKRGERRRERGGEEERGRSEEEEGRTEREDQELSEGGTSQGAARSQQANTLGGLHAC